MIYIIKKTLIAFTMLPIVLLSTEIASTIKTKDLAIYYIFNGDIEKSYTTLIEKKLKSIGFNCLDPHKRINDKYKEKWGSSELDILSFMPIVKDRTILPLLNIDPRIAGFSLFNLVIHKKIDENITQVGHLVPEVMLDILGIENNEVRRKFSADFKGLDATIAQELGGEESTISYKKLPKQTMINFEYDFTTPKDMEDFIDEFQNKFELTFTKRGYLIAGYHNFMQSTDNAKEILSNYDAFWTYSLCHLEFSYNIFDTKGARPDAGLFAPCTMYMYIKKGSNKVVAGMHRLQNWSDILDFKNKKRLNLVKKLDIEIPEILTSLGMYSVPNSNPLLTKTIQKTTREKIKQPIAIKSTNTYNISIPIVPTVVKANVLQGSIHSDRSIKFSKRVPPNYIPHSFDKRQKEKTSINTRIGEANEGQISAYLRGDFMEVETLKSTLKSAGFDIISASPVNKKEDLTSIVFTNDILLGIASKDNRGFMASLRALVDIKEKTISITNPLYMAKGFLQNDFEEKKAKEVLKKLINAFPRLQNSQDTLKYHLLEKYQFMKGMPTYNSMIEVASGANLLEKLKDNKRVTFVQSLQNGSTLVGIKLSKRTRKFTDKIGRNNAGMLPYPILIENGKAKILDPKYYISFMYPKLTMSEFMGIATVPDAMVKDCERVFR